MSNNQQQPNRQLPPTQRQSISEATREAESRSLDFDPNERASYVRRMLRDIALWMSQGDSEQVIMERVPDFAEQYPRLFKALINHEDLSPIQSMLAMLDKMGEGSLSQHQASVIVGKRLVDRYITPQLKGNGSNK
jgi:hypothetical protein